MRLLCVGLLILGTATFAHAINLGGLLDTIKKGASGIQGDQDAQSGKKKQPTLQDLAGLVKGTPVAEEIAIGEELAGRLLGASPLVKDNTLQKYVNKVGKWVAMQSGRTDLVWNFGILDSPDINAFAAPGGFIFLTKGLYQTLSSEAELAGVIGHEIGHVIKRHHLNVLKKSKAIDIASSVLSGVVGSVGNETADKAVQNLIGSGAEIMARGLDKDAEYEADRIGVVVATRAGYDSYGLPSVLQEIGHVSASDSSVSLLFKTHPHPITRLNELDAAMGETFDEYTDGKLVVGRFYRLR